MIKRIYYLVMVMGNSIFRGIMISIAQYVVMGPFLFHAYVIWKRDVVLTKVLEEKMIAILKLKDGNDIENDDQLDSNQLIR